MRPAGRAPTGGSTIVTTHRAVRVVAAAVAVTAALSLTACGTGSGKSKHRSGSHKTGSTSHPTSTRTSTATPSPTRSCRASVVPSGHRMVAVERRPASATQLTARDAVYACGRGWQPSGQERTYTLATGATATLAGSGAPQQVTVTRLVEHLGTCLAGRPDTPACLSGSTWELTLDQAGRVTAMAERPDS